MLNRTPLLIEAPESPASRVARQTIHRQGRDVKTKELERGLREMPGFARHATPLPGFDAEQARKLGQKITKKRLQQSKLLRDKK